MNSSSSPISASVISHIFSSDSWLKEVRYVIKVVDTSGESEIHRSSKDFKILRKILDVRWPGCIIPVIPSEYTKSNPSQPQLLNSIYVHNHFLSKIISTDFLSSSDVFQLFLKGPVDFVKLTNAYHIPTYPKIAENFENSFKDSIDYQMNEDTPSILNDRKESFKLQLKSVSTLDKLLSSQSSLLQDFKSANKKMLGLVEQTYKWIDSGHPDYEYSFDSSHDNLNLSFWLLGQMVELESIIRAIEKIQELTRVREMTVKSIQSTSLELQKLNMGKKSLSMIFNSKSKDEFISAKQRTLEEFNEQLKALDIMVPLLSSKMLSETIQRFEGLGEAQYEKQVKGFCVEFCKDLAHFKGKLIRNS